MTTESSIVFVHGLQGHPRNTWTWESNKGISDNTTPIESKPKVRKRKVLSNWFKRENVSPKPVQNGGRSMVFWPYHLLYKECPNSRILTWGYDSMISTFFHGSANQNNFFSHARNLLGDLNRERNQCVNDYFRIKSVFFFLGEPYN